jgi:hypothetical protein
MRRYWVFAGLFAAGLTLAACSSGPPPPAGLGVSSKQVVHFFSTLGGDGWKLTMYGGAVGFAGGDAGGHYCPTVLLGSRENVTHINVICWHNGSTYSSTPQQSAGIITATVNRFAPGASKWAEKTVDAAFSSGSVPISSTFVTDGKFVQIIVVRGSPSPTEVSLGIAPMSLVANTTTTSAG